MSRKAYMQMQYVLIGLSNVLGANFALVGIPSVGASGYASMVMHDLFVNSIDSAIFGTVAVTWVDLFAHWRYHYRSSRKARLRVQRQQ